MQTAGAAQQRACGFASQQRALRCRKNREERKMQRISSIRYRQLTRERVQRKSMHLIHLQGRHHQAVLASCRPQRWPHRGGKLCRSAAVVAVHVHQLQSLV